MDKVYRKQGDKKIKKRVVNIMVPLLDWKGKPRYTPEKINSMGIDNLWMKQKVTISRIDRSN